MIFAWIVYAGQTNQELGGSLFFRTVMECQEMTMMLFLLSTQTEIHERYQSMRLRALTMAMQWRRILLSVLIDSTQVVSCAFGIKTGRMVTYYTSTYLAFEQPHNTLRFSWSKLFTMLLGNERRPMGRNYQALQILLGAIKHTTPSPRRNPQWHGFGTVVQCMAKEYG